MTTILRSLACCVAMLLAACGGGDDADDPNAVPLGAKVCELRQRAAGLPLLPAEDVYDDDRMASPAVRLAGDDLFTVDYPFAPGTLPYPLPEATLNFQVNQFGYHVRAETLLWRCALEGLAPGDKVVIRGGPRNEGGHFYVSVQSELVLEGKKVTSEWVGFWIEY